MAPVRRGHRAGFYGMRRWAANFLAGSAITVATVLSYEHALGVLRDVEHARAIALAVLIIAGATITTVLSGFGNWAPRIVIAASIASLVMLVQIPAVTALVHLRPLHLQDWTIAIVAGAGSGALSLLFKLWGGNVRSTGLRTGASHGAA
jgi:Ca2+-transporting ATPase